tara:strand:- start:186 stop:608 length:423 start_codon:yes stop_codon:yes gene_type:complete
MNVPFRFSSRSLERLRTCHADLVLVMTEAIADPDCPSDFSVLEGFRDEAAQDAAYDSGASQLRWPQSRHNSTPSMAVDVAPYVDGGVTWDWAYYYPLADHVKRTWNRLSLEGATTGDYHLTWGGDWATLKDGPHWQLDPV